MRGNLRAKVEPLHVVRKLDTRPVKARPLTYSPIKAAQLVACMTTLMGVGLAFLSVKTVRGSLAMAAPKKRRYRLISDYRAANKQIEKGSGIMLDLEAERG